MILHSMTTKFNIRNNEVFDVIIIGGGITGAGTARDCALRGLKALLLERYDFSVGATGRNHGLLHSGARYAVSNPESARECILENKILRRIASHCIEETGGLFITLPEDDIDYQNVFVNACRNTGISVDVLEPSEALRLEPSANPHLVGAVKVPDGSIDPFRLTMANLIDARRHGAKIKTYTKVTSIIRSGNRAVAVDTINTRTSEESCFEGKYIVNAGGIWGKEIARLAGLDIEMYPAKGSLLIFGHRINRIVLNRCRKPSDADILVPSDIISILGTTSTKIPYEEIDRMEVSIEEVDALLNEGMKLSPKIAYSRIIRAFAGVRPLVSAQNDGKGRDISRGFVCIDHSDKDGLEGFVSILGGKLMTYRLMAECVTDLVCKKIGVYEPCRTAIEPLPGSENYARDIYSRQADNPRDRAKTGRFGTLSEKITSNDKKDSALVCECEQVSTAEIKYAIEYLRATNLFDLRRRTQMGMGSCQGQLCAGRAAGLLSKFCKFRRDNLADLASFLNERWHGVYPIAWGNTLSKTELTEWLYNGVGALDVYVEQESIPINQHRR